MRPSGVKTRTARFLEGEFEFSRAVFECPRCRKSAAPLDREFGLGPHEHLSRLVRKKAAWAVAHESGPQAVKSLSHQAGIVVSAAEVARVAEAEGLRLDELQREREEMWNEKVSCDRPVAPPESACERLVVSADATSVLTRSGEEHKMVYCATAHDLSARIETEAGRKTLASRRYAASGVDFDDFGSRARALANRLGARGATETAFLADGAPCLWSWAGENLPGAVMIQDIWHVIDRLAGVAKELHPDGGPQRAELLSRWKSLLEESRCADVIEELDELARRRRGRIRESLLAESAYLEKGKHRMDYKRYRDEGWPIGSGSVEGTCKHLVKQRFGVTGARFKRERIPHLLALRLSIFNEEWENDWTAAKALLN